MASVESNTLLEKLISINEIKNRIRQAIIDVGGEETMDETTPFDEFPNIIYGVFTVINTTGKSLKYFVEGGDYNEIIQDNITKFANLIQYINELGEAKQLLVENLRTKGVLVSMDESIESLANKILEINNN